MVYDVQKAVKGTSVYYTVHWSPVSFADKYDINCKVPAIGGIAEIYFMDVYNKLNLICTKVSWFGGLRATIRESCDPILEKDPINLSIITRWSKRLYYRWTHSENYSDMSDIAFFLSRSRPGKILAQSSGRFSLIFLKEINTGKLIDI